VILIIDNHDSFTYLLMQCFYRYYGNVTVKNKGEVNLEDVKRMNPAALILSPGPGHPDEAALCFELLQHYEKKLPILGICLGMQIIVRYFQGAVIRNFRLMHGKLSDVYHRKSDIFRRIPNPMTCMRYHSLVADRQHLPQNLEVTAYTDEHEIMAVRCTGLPIFGVQFHPESIGTRFGLKIIGNFVNDYVKKAGKRR